MNFKIEIVKWFSNYVIFLKSFSEIKNTLKNTFFSSARKRYRIEQSKPSNFASRTRPKSLHAIFQHIRSIWRGAMRETTQKIWKNPSKKLHSEDLSQFQGGRGRGRGKSVMRATNSKHKKNRPKTSFPELRGYTMSEKSRKP